MNTALLVIDVQVGITDYVPSNHKDKFLGNINDLLTRARAARVPVVSHPDRSVATTSSISSSPIEG